MKGLSTPKSILVIEDDHDTRVSLRLSLEQEGYFVFSAPNGKLGIETLRRIKAPSLILLDLVMPIMNGEEFIQAIENDPELHMIPVVLVSAYPEKAKKLIAKAFISKPVDLKTLLQAVADHSGS
ncbi:MAG: response regulator [Bdellovibrionota bacterium]